MERRLRRTCGAGWALALAACGLGAVPSAQTPAPVTPAQTFRSEVELIPVDVHVVDRTGRPVAGLSADKFEVRINGQRRRIVTTTYVEAATPPPPPPSMTSSSVPPAAAPPASHRRLYVLAVDVSSFDESAGRPLLRRAASFIRQLRPEDEVGLFAYPLGPKVDFTTDHDAVIRALDTVMARREKPVITRFNLSLSDIVDISRGGRVMEAVVDRICEPLVQELLCPEAVEGEAMSAVLVYEALAQTSISPLLALMTELGRIPERKTVVLVSGGLPSGEVGGRPDHNKLGYEAGRVAAQHNVNLYTLFLDQLWMSTVSAESATPMLGANAGRDSTIMGRWLADVSEMAGGSLLRVAAGDGAFAFDRILSETSGYYLLGVEPTEADRDGRAHQLRVTVGARDVTVRGRQWVVVPKPGAAPTVASAAAARPPAPVLPPTPPSVVALAGAFDRDDRAAIAAALAPRDADTVIEAFRVSASPWPGSPRRTAAFALELALVGVRSDSPFTREAALKLLVEYAIRVRQPEANDVFECTWLWAAIAGAEGLMQTRVGAVLADRAVDRCPADPSLRLARAVVRDQQLADTWALRATRRSLAVAPSEFESFVLGLYDAAAASSLTRFEARVRAAALHWRAGRFDAGLVEIAKRGAVPDDPDMAYLADLVQGQLLLGLGRAVDAVTVFRRASGKRPDAQSARVSLLTALASAGQFTEASTLAGQVLGADGALIDPWTAFPLGDYRAFGSIRQRLRELAP